MKRAWILALVAAALVAAGACGKKSPEPATETVATPAPAAEAAAETAPAAVADSAEVSTGGGGVVVKGSGNGRVGPIAFDKPYYIVRVAYDGEEYSMMEASYKADRNGNEVDANLGFFPSGTRMIRVFQPQGQASITFDVKSQGTYTIEFQAPPALDAAQAAPRTFPGGEGWTITPPVRTAGNYVMLRLKYTGPVDPQRVGGLPLAMANLYDAETGDPWVSNQSVYDHNVETQDGHTGRKPGAFFAIVSCGKKDGAWEVTITED